ncbi:MAG: hypothetical protein ACP5U2_10970 [Bryobacteraceae bacterium]
MTQSDLIRSGFGVLVLACAISGGQPAPPPDTGYQVGTAPPRLLLRPQRLRLLQRERARQSMRWEQLAALVERRAQLPEPGFALALYYRASGDEQAGRQAVAWALSAGSDLRQLALVLDWCGPTMDASQTERLAKRLEQALGTKPGDGVAENRSRALAAIALTDYRPQLAAAELRRLVENWWRGKLVPALQQGSPIPRQDHYALFELLHALRDNLDLDLREDARWYFKDLPLYRLISYYPATYPSAENDYRIPASASAQPDLVAAMLSRAADMAMVAYEPNAQETQFLQGWVMQDRYLMRHPFGVPYEFLWANPYHPGLTYHSLPLIHHDPRLGMLFLRSSWEDDAAWLGWFEGSLQLCREGRPERLDPRKNGAPIQIGEATVIPVAGRSRLALPRSAGPIFLLGLEPGRHYELEVDDEEMREEQADRGGILVLPAGTAQGLRLRASSPAAQR